jgi:hypothetical protein
MKLRSTLFSAATGSLVAVAALAAQDSMKKANRALPFQNKSERLAKINDASAFSENEDKETMMLMLSSF